MKTKITKYLLCTFLSIMLAASIAVVWDSDVQATEETATSGACGDNLTWTYDEETKTLNIEGTGAMTNYEWGDYAPWRSLDVTKVVIGDGVTTIGSWAFDGMNKITSIEGGENLVEISNRAISSCSGLTSFKIPATVTTIGSQAFDGSSNLATVTGGEGVTALANDVFAWCSNLENIPEFPKLTSIGYKAFFNTKWLANQKDFAVVNGIMIAYQGTDTEIVIPDTITGFADVYGTKLFPDTIKKVTFPDSYTTIPARVFNNNKGLEEIVFGNNVEVIGESSFSGCTSLASVVIPDTVKEISERAFSGCEKLATLTIPDGVFLGNSAFSKCTSLTLQGMNIGKVGFGQYVFSSTDVESKFGFCGTDVMWKLDEEGTMTIYPFRKTSAEMTTNPRYNTASTSDNQLKSSVKKVIVESGITSLYDAFDGYAVLESVVLPATLVKIDYRSFANTASLKTIILPESITEVGSYAFLNSGITEISLPAALTTIGTNAFEGTVALSKLVVPENVTSLGYRFIEESGVKELVLNANITYSSSQPFDGCTTLEKVTFNKGSAGSAWESILFRDSNAVLKEIIIGKDVTGIGEYAFSGLTALQKVTLENGACTSIGNNAFLGCTSLIEIDIPANVTKIGESAFEGCTALNKVIFHEGLKVISRYAFFDCPTLKEVTIPYSVTTIGDYAFNTYCEGDGDRWKDNWTPAWYENFLMRGYINTEAESYAYRTTGITFEPIGGDISRCTMYISPSSFTYDGTAKEPTVTIKTKNGNVLPESAYTGPNYSNNVNVGKASASVTAKEPFTGTLTNTFTIKEPEGTGSGDSGSTEEAIISAEEKAAIYERYYPVFADLSEIGYADPTMVDELLAVIKTVNSNFTKADVYVLLEENGIQYDKSESSGDTSCTHSWNKDYTVDKAATCTSTGSKSIHCANCDATKDVTTIAKLAHKWNSGVITTKATCTKAGLKTYTCSGCGGKKTETIKATGHNYKVTKTTKATTKKNGKLAKQCKVCKAKATETLYRAKSISLSKTKFVYNGKTQKPKVTVKDSKGKVISSSNYKVKFSKGCKNAGTYKVTVTFKGQYSGKLTKSFKITKAKPKITASNFTKIKGDKAFSIKPKVSPKGGKVTYKSSNKKIATVSSKGKVTIKKAGKVTITITSASNKNCKKVTKKITVTVKPK